MGVECETVMRAKWNDRQEIHKKTYMYVGKMKIKIPLR